MTSPVRSYLSDLGRELHLAEPKERDILNEIEDHIEDSARELMDEGIPAEDAISSAIEDMGASNRVARQLYEVHTKGSWHHTALAALPHLLLSLLFALGLWRVPGWLVVILAAAIGISVFGWRKGRPIWTFPWLGYVLVAPIVSWGLALSAVGYGAWRVLTQGSLPLTIPVYAVSFVYVAASIWVVVRMVSTAARRDWLIASMSIMPVPFLAFWFVFFYNQEAVLASKGQMFYGVDTTAAIVFLILAATTALFFRVSRRMVRIVLLVVTVPSMAVLAWMSYQGGPGYMALFTLASMSAAVVVGPVLLDLKAGQARVQIPAPEETG